MTGDEKGINHLTGGERRTVAEFVEGLRNRFDGELRAVILFGSRARGEADPASDMDVLVVMASVEMDTRKWIRNLAVEVWLKHGIYVSTRVWDQSHWRRLEELRTLLFQNIRRDGIELLQVDSIGP